MNVRSVAIMHFCCSWWGGARRTPTVSRGYPAVLPRNNGASILPHPTPADTIRFSGPTPVYSNSCDGGEGLGGTPQILVDTKAKVITLWFKGPAPQVCPMIFSPVAGLEGDFGPLPAGNWMFTCLSRDPRFEIHFTIWDKFAYYVDADARGSVHDGRSWETAMLTLQDALAVAGSGDEILIAAGVYKPDQGGQVSRGDRKASFDLLKPGVGLWVVLPGMAPRPGRE